MAYDKERVAYLLGQPRTTDNVNELVRLNAGLLFKQLKRFHLVKDHNAISLGYEALFQAIMTYDSIGGSKFSTYATVSIYNRVGSYIRTLKTAKADNCISYETPIGASTTIGDTLQSKDTVDDDQMVLAIRGTIEKCCATYNNPMHQRILRMWIGSEFTMTQLQIAVLLNCSQTYVSQVIKNFKYKLEAMLNE